jgi:crotonobetainyl-CoA:carnitine CoA-transferase CaiB-like acyl-CoA transferase
MTKLPLEGIKVADFSWFGAGPICAENLGRFGATVVRVESEAHIDGLRQVMPFAQQDCPDCNGAGCSNCQNTGKVTKTGYNVSGYFNNYNAGKLGITINLQTELGQQMGRQLIAWADVFITNHTPRIIEKWGLEYDAVAKIKPGIIAVYQPMQGFDGPHKHFFGFGAVLNAITGYNNLSGFPNRPPMGLGTNYPDYVINPGHTLVAILAALRYRKKTGKGQRIELAQIESSVAPLAPAVMDYMANGKLHTRQGNRLSYASPHGAFRCQDEEITGAQHDRWVAFGIFSDAQWRVLADAMGNPAWAADAKFATLEGRKANEDELETNITEWTRPQLAEDVMSLLQSKGIAAGVVHNSRDVLDRDVHLKARQYYQYLDHPETGRAAYDGAPFRLSKTPGSLKSPAPLLGEHNEYVCKEILGMSDEEIAEALVQQALY